MPLNILGGELALCSADPLTGYLRDGCCTTGAGDTGVHTVCAVMSDEFLAFTKERGNDLSTPRPQWGFAGLRAGDRWCLCAPRWQEALEAGVAPAVVLAGTHELSVEWCDRAALIAHAIDPPESRA